MKPETEEAIHRLNTASLLQGGMKLDGARYVPVTSFETALRVAGGASWDRFIANVYNGIFSIDIQRRIRSEASDDHRWISTLESIRSSLAPSTRALRAISWTNVTRFPFELLLNSCCLELEISHIIRPVFFYPHVFPVLCAGHFPCGWQGKPIPREWSPNGPEDMPLGKVMVWPCLDLEDTDL